MTKSRKRNTPSANRIPTRSVGRMVRSLVNQMAETKNYINTQATTLSLVGGAVFPITQHIIEGDELNQRSGRQIALKSIELRLAASIPVGTQFATLRFVLFMDRMNLGAVPVTTDVLDSSTTTSPYAATSWQAHRFKILHDSCCPMVFSGADQQIFKKIVVKPKDKVEFNNAADVAGSNFKNSVHLLVLSDTVGALAPSFNFTVSVFYSDL